MRQIVLDTETTGLEWKKGNRVVEIGCVELVERRPTGRTYHQYIKPDRDFEQGAAEVTGLSLEFLADKPPFADIADAFLEFIEGAELIMIVRQRDGDPRELIAIVEATPGDAQPYYRAMIEDAYSWPQFVTPQYQQQAAQDFAMRIYSVCRSEAL